MRPSALDIAQARLMSEDQLYQHVRGLCEGLGLLHYHTYDSRRSQPGYPDLAILGRRRYLLRERRRRPGHLSPDQHRWLTGLARVGIDVAVWRPSDLLSGSIGRELLNAAGHDSRRPDVGGGEASSLTGWRGSLRQASASTRAAPGIRDEGAETGG